MKIPSLFTALCAITLCATGARAQMVTGSDMADFNATFALAPPTDSPLSATLVSSSAPGNVLWPGEQPHFALQLRNSGAQNVQINGAIEVISYGTRGIAGDIWKPQTVRFGVAARVPFAKTIAAKSATALEVAPQIPATLGGYGLVADFGEGKRQFVGSFVRTFKANAERVQFPKFCLDELPLPVMKRLGVGAIRLGVSYKPTTDRDYAAWYAEQGRHLKELQDANIAVLFMIGGGDYNHPDQPLGRPRPWLDSQGVMQDTKFDLAWTPDYDADFQKYVRQFATDYGWPRGPINAFSLWNEPWEGISISGWGADLPRYRELYRHMAAGVREARAAGSQVLVGGTDSTSNALDKLFGDEAGRAEFLPQFDFLSIHYQGLAPSSNLKLWQTRQGYGGRVKIWDTESWVANTDDRVAAVVAANRAAGYDRAMGVFGENIAQTMTSPIQNGDETREVHTVNAWSTAAAIGASQHFIGERLFREMVFPNGLPWVMRFDGLNGQADDGTLVVVGDLGEEFGANNVLFRTARGHAERAHKAALRKQLAALPATETEARAKLQAQTDAPETLSGATLTLRASGDDYALFDFYGNRVAARGDQVVVPLDGRGFFLRAQKSGGFARLVAAVQAGQISGIEPLAIVAHDFVAPIGSKPSLRLTLTNVLNRPVTGTLSAQIPGLKLASVPALTLAPNAARTIEIPVASGAARPDNAYALSVRFASKAGAAPLDETIHANVISRLTPTIDGDLRAWKDALPQTIAGGGSAPSTTEAAWFPFKNFDATQKNGLATGYLGYDDNNFYFAAKIADATPDAGMVRQSTRDDDSYFYPETSYFKPGAGGQEFSARWSGEIEAPVAGKYTFQTTSDDGVRLFVDDKAVIDNWTDHGATDDRAQVELTAGRHPIRLEFYQSGGGALMQLKWQTPDGDLEIVPTSSLFPREMNGGINGANVGNGLRGEYFAGRALDGKPLVTRLDNAVNFSWEAGQTPDAAFNAATPIPLQWPAGVRRYSYRRDPDLPSGNAPNHDNVQIAFNVLPSAQKPMMDKLPGVPAHFTTYSNPN